MSAEDMEKAGKALEYLRFVKFENGCVTDAKASRSTMVDMIASAMSNNEDLADAVQMAISKYKMMKHPLGKLLYGLREMMEDGECQCEDCKAKRETEKKETADAENPAG